MKKLILLAALATTGQANALLVEFRTGDVVTAAAMNGNFQNLQTKDGEAMQAIQALTAKIEASTLDLDSIKSGNLFTPNAKVNGVPVSIYDQLSSFSVYFNAKSYLSVNKALMPSYSYVKFTSKDCSGRPYSPSEVTIDNIETETLKTGNTRYNQLIVNDGKVYEPNKDLLYKIIAQSYRDSSGNCIEISSSPAISYNWGYDEYGISLPLVFTDHPLSDLTISDEYYDIPDVPVVTKGAEVSANGEVIGYYRSHYTNTGLILYVNMTLTNYGQENIRIYPDGTYTYSTGYTSPSSIYLYYTSENCTGQPYYLLNFNSVFGTNSVKPFIKMNNESYYSIGGDVYQVNELYSRVNNDGACYTYSIPISDRYTLSATVTDNPKDSQPIFQPPITVEGLDFGQPPIQVGY